MIAIPDAVDGLISMPQTGGGAAAGLRAHYARQGKVL